MWFCIFLYILSCGEPGEAGAETQHSARTAAPLRPGLQSYGNGLRHVEMGIVLRVLRLGRVFFMCFSCCFHVISRDRLAVAWDMSLDAVPSVVKC